MTAVRLGESARYGLRLYAYVLGIALVGGAGVGLGAALAWPEVAAWRGPGQAEVVPGVAGGILLFLGLSVLAIGYLGTAYKLVADGVAAGRAGPAAVEEPADGAEEPPAPSPADPNVGEPAPADAEAPASGPETTEVGSMAAEESAPPEPSPEEIAFGSSSEEASEGSSSADEAGGSANPGSLPGQNAASDPLADPSEE